MPLPRRDFMKLFGVSLGSLLLARCQRAATEDAFTAGLATIAPTLTENPWRETELFLRESLRQCWLRFGELAGETRELAADEDGGWEGNPLGVEMSAEHRAVLDRLTAAGEITAPVAELIQEAYDAAVHHIWRSNAPMTCYLVMGPDYAANGAGDLLARAEVLTRVADGTPIAPGTVSKVRAALEHDMAYYALSDADVLDLYEKVLKEYSGSGESFPTFDQLELTLTPEARAAAQFLLEVLMG